MPAVGASTWLLICCGTALHLPQSDNSVPDTRISASSARQSTPTISHLKMGPKDEMQITPDPDQNLSKVGGVNININFGSSGVLPDSISTADESNLRLKSGKNILQINIFNNGAPEVVSQNSFLKKSGKDFMTQESDLTNSHQGVDSPTSEIDLTTSETGSSTSDLPWWKSSVIYQIYPRSFMDSSGSGTGDIKGITSKVDYLKDLGIGAVWLSPVYVSPMADFGYDIANFTDIDPIFGTLQDLDELIEALHARGIKIIMDFIPNHTSDKHPWFEKSVKRIAPYTDYYVWQDPKGLNESGSPIPPNNWLSVFRFSAWEWNEERGQFYLHQFLKEQPDLNVRNPAVMEELNNVVKFWLDRGVDGFRIDALKHMFEVKDLTLDEPVAIDSGAEDPNEYDYLNHTYSVNQPETVDAVKEWRKISDSYEDRMLMTEVYDADIEQIMKYYGNKTDLVSHFPFNFYLITELINRTDVTGINLKETLDIWLDNIAEGMWPNWVLGNHDRPRVATRLGKDLVDALNMLSLLLPGTPTTYYGEEIGMEDTFVTFDQVKDPFGINFGPERYQEFGRDPERTPMQWDSTTNAGFSNSNTTWLPVNDNYVTLNVQNQMNSTQSSLKVFQNLTKLRQQRVFTHGNFDYVAATESLFAFARHLEGEPTYLIVINTSPTEMIFNMTEITTYQLPEEAFVTIRSSTDSGQQGTTIGSRVFLEELPMIGGEGLVLKLES